MDVESSRSIVINDEAMTIGGNSDEDLDLTSEQKNLVDFYNVDQADEQTEHQGPCAVEGSSEEALLVEEVLTGDEENGEEIHGIRQEERGTPVDSVECGGSRSYRRRSWRNATSR